MQLVEVKNDIAKIVYNPSENHLLPSDFLLLEDNNQKLIAQIVNIETTETSNNNLAILRLSLSIDKEDNLSLFNGYIPAKNSKILYINPDEIMELIQGSGINIYFGNLSNHSSCFVKPSVSFLNDKLYIQSDRDDKTNIIVQNIITELQNKNKHTILLDFDGRFNNLQNVLRLKVSENFKLPLNIDAFNTILEYDIVDCPLDDKAVIQSIVLELREYLQTLTDKYLPFTMFKNVVDDEFLSNPVSGLMLFRNKLWLYAQDKIFAEDKSQFDILNDLFQKTNTILIDASSIDEKWHKFIVQTILALVDNYCYFILSLNDIRMDKKSIINLYNKENVIPVVSTSYESKYRQILKSICKNQVLCKPAKYLAEDEKYSLLLNRINTSEMILYGETTLYLPLTVDLQLFTPDTAQDVISNEIKKDVDKLLSSPQTVISPDTLNADISKPDDNNAIVEEDELTDSDLDFLDETLNDDETKKSEEPEKEQVHYELFNPVQSSHDEEDVLKDDSLLPLPESIDSLPDVNSDVIKELPVQENSAVEPDETTDGEVILNEAVPDSKIEVPAEESSGSDEDIIPIDDVIQGITDKLDNSTDASEAENSSSELHVELESDDDVEPPSVNENIREKKSPDLPVYETDSTTSMFSKEIPFKIGDTVYHPKHGKGVIEGFANYSNKILFCQIDFENVGRRILDPRIAGIEKVS